MPDEHRGPGSAPARVSLATIAVEWGRIGCTGFGGPPTHIALLRKLCVERRGWMGAEEFEDGIAATNHSPPLQALLTPPHRRAHDNGSHVV